MIMHETARNIRSGRENNGIPEKRSAAFHGTLNNSDETAGASFRE
jgi:hypothetical protein